MTEPPYSLSGNCLIVYSILWHYARAKVYKVSYNTFATWWNIPKTTVMKSIKELQKRGLVEVTNINAHKTFFQAKAIPGYPLPVIQYNILGYTDQNEPLMVKNRPSKVQNGPFQYNLYNNNSNNNYQKRFNKIYNEPYSGPTSEAPYRMTDEQKRELEEQQRAEDRRRREEHDKLANTPEALAARDRFFAKFCPEEKSMCS